MPPRPEQLLRRIRKLATQAAPEPDSDAVLLGRFLHHQDEAAFATLVRRHGPLVLAVGRRVLGDLHAAEDVLQATFLLLARKAATVRTATLAAWLHGTARRLALKCHRTDTRRQQREVRAVRTASDRQPADPLDELTARELLRILDEEVQRLPEAFRLPVLLCCLEGRTQEEAARLLGWTAGSVRGRLERGRKRLHTRLARRGLTLSAVLAAAELSRGAVSASLLGTTIQAAMLFAAGKAVTDGLVSANVARLTKGALQAMLLKKLTFTAVLLLAVGVAAFTGPLAYRSLGGGQTGPQRPQGAPVQGTEEARPQRFPTAEPSSHWGQPHNGLRLGVVAEGPGRGGARFAFALENVGKDDLVINLGAMLANGKKQYPSALRLTLTDAKGAERHLRRTFAFVAGRVDPFVVPLPVGSRYTLRYDLADFMDEERPGEPFAPGPYGAAVEFIGKAVAREETNSDSAGLALMPYWTGTVRSAACKLTLPVEPQAPQIRPGPLGPKQDAPPEARPLRATLGVNQQTFVEGETGTLQLSFILINDSGKVIDPKVPASKIIVNGKALPDSAFILGNGPRPTNFNAMQPGERVEFGAGLGRYFRQAGVYRVSWEGENFRSAEITFNVERKNSN